MHPIYTMLLGNVMFQKIKFPTRGLGATSFDSQGLDGCARRLALAGSVGEGISSLLQVISVSTKSGYEFTYLALDRVERPFRSLIMLTRHLMMPFASGSSPTLRTTAIGCPFIIVPLSSRAFWTDLGLANITEAYRLTFGSQWAYSTRVGTPDMHRIVTSCIKPQFLNK